MKNRCHNPRATQYHWYGARGIVVCERWRHSFAAFLADVGPRPPRHSLDRIDNAGNYEPGNVRWASSVEQQSNTRRNKLLTFRGTTATQREWERRMGLPRGIVHLRLSRLGWDVERALTTPSQQKGGRNDV